MSEIFAGQALTSDGWKNDVLITILPDGRIGSLEQAEPTRSCTRVDMLLPAPVNVHSHAFQRAMAGMTEGRIADDGDSFWTWRQTMYRFLEALTPDDVEAIAAFVQVEMLEAGYATNTEFHYLHHQPDGAAYENPAEMAERIIAAADSSGIGLTLLPVHYRYGGCDGRSLALGQVRFGTDPDTFQSLVERANLAPRQLPDDCKSGIALHSLRAVSSDDLPGLVELADRAPIHMHVAEQVAEVEEVRKWLGARPVEWLLENVDLSNQWCLIHLTQMTEQETLRLAQTGVVAGLCPITESSLGDGTFNGIDWLSSEGAIAVGSDSNIRISLSEELRTLEYSQRLRHRCRSALADAGRSTGRRLFDDICAGGARAAARGSGQVQVGEWADMLALDMTHVDLAGRRGDMVLDSFIFAGDDHMITDVWSAGRHLVTGGRHRHRDRIAQAYRKTIARLVERL